MRNTLFIVLGIALFIFGAVALAQGGIPHPAHHAFDIAIAKGSVDTQEMWVVQPVMAGLALVAGVALILAGARARQPAR